MTAAQAGNIPDELKRRRQWVLWRKEQRDGGPTKVPYNVQTGLRAETDNPQTWASFDEANDASGGFDGIGFVFSADDPLDGVDLDGCLNLETGEIAEWAVAITEQFPGAYAETSPSGTGLHLIFRGEWPSELHDKSGWRRPVPGVADLNGKKPMVEAYCRERFFATTGCSLGEALPELPDCTEALRELTRRFVPPKVQAKNGSKPAAVVDLDDHSLLEKAKACQKTGDDFSRLWQGDISGHADDESRADYHLCRHLAFWTGKDTARMDRLFQASGLYREKWDREDYRDRTIQAAVEACTDTYNPQYYQQSSSVAVRRDDSFSTTADDDVPVNVTDMGNATRLARRHGQDVRFSSGFGWLIWDGQRWQRDETQEIERRAKETVRSIYAEAANCLHDGERKELVGWAKSSEAAQRVMAMVRLAQSEPGVPIRGSDLDGNPWLLNVKNGTIDLRTGTLREHCRADLITHLAPIVYDPTATCPIFERFVGEVMAGKADLTDYLQRWAGYCLTGDVSEQMLLFSYGLGANGKSTLLRVLLAVLGDYAMQAAPGLLLDRKSDRHPTELAELRGKRLVISVEVGEGKRLAEELVKQMTGGDRIKGRFMRQDFFEFDPEFKLLLAANHKPVIKGTDHAIWRRIPLLPFEVTFTDDGEPKKDSHLIEKLMGELPGILAWCVRGCLAWQRQRLIAPAKVKEATASYRAEMDVIAGFIDDCCIQSEAVWAKASDLYAAYGEWCEANGENRIKQKAFGDRLSEKGCSAARIGHKQDRIWRGIGLRSDDRDNLQTDRSADFVPESRMQTDADASFGIADIRGSHEAAMRKNASASVCTPRSVCRGEQSSQPVNPTEPRRVRGVV